MTGDERTGTVLGQARERLAAAGVWDVEGDLSALADRFLVRADPEAARAEFEAALAERCARVPLGHITGSVVFDGLVFAVGSGVFVPRSQSTALIEWAAGKDVLPPGGRALDLCSGVGALGIALAARRPDTSVTCVERDDTAVQYLRRNAARHAGAAPGVTVEVKDLLVPGCLDELAGGVDLVLANPPYVPPGVRLLPEWSVHHPKAAVYSGEDGLDLIRAVVGHAGAVLRPGGRLALEHDEAQPALVRELLAAGGFSEATTLSDSAGDPRITVARVTRQETS
ncbi:HemK/PrmC family methyltransferase [Streptomyces sp. NPDC047017]|uniref:N5-glutamine methyltransferase family protein n=1 Tax=Streptomyces sp. NPDC047017 TaxID=3155024 RepID=UPI0033FB0251